jgi:hypothetical protein
MSFQESAADDGRAFLQVMPRYSFVLRCVAVVS